jgi:glucosamine--fructose-6-phosphate aminotransferase (isomerizing)
VRAITPAPRVAVRPRARRVLGHTRWASVGIISEPNAHPINSDELEQPAAPPYLVGALNGDVDNHADLRVEHRLRIHGQITTDAKVIPRSSAATGAGPTRSSPSVARSPRSTGRSRSGDEPRRDPTHLLALSGSGQGLYSRASRGQLHRRQRTVRRRRGRHCSTCGSTASTAVRSSPSTPPRAGEPGGHPAHALRRDRTSGDRRRHRHATVTTRRLVDRGDFPHFLLKEITESPSSMRKDVARKIVERDGRASRSAATARAHPEIAGAIGVRHDHAHPRHRPGQRRRSPGQSTAALLDELAGGALDVAAITATELSGFGLRRDMSQTLAIAVSQSGTTTDTNRTVDLLRGRGAAVLAIVNRRSSDLTDKADGVLYTSDGRDVEMSVASTKRSTPRSRRARCSPARSARAAGVGTAQRRHELLTALRRLPDAMREVLTRRPIIAEAARRFAPTKRYWAVVGSGANKVAAEEVRIKLSELCYKSIACDVTEDKKHIDLSSEPLILVCAAGLRGSTADDVAKEIAIFRAHKATPIVIADEGEQRYARRRRSPCRRSIRRSASCCRRWSGTCSATRRRWPSTRRRARCARRASRSSGGRRQPRRRCRARRAAHADRPLRPRFLDGLRDHIYDGHLEASHRGALVGLLRDRALQRRSSSTRRRPAGRHARRLVDELVMRLTRAIEELTRPVDAIKHQAKTVTVGISRSDEGVVDRALVQRPARRRRPRRAHVPHAQGARRPRPGRRRGHRLHPVPRRRQHDLDRRPRRDLARPAVARRHRLAARRHQAPRRRVGARCSSPAAAATGAP